MNALVAVLFLASAVVAKPTYFHGAAVAPLAYHAAPAVAPVAAVAAPVAYAASVSVPVTKHVHYASTPVVTGYSSTVVKPVLGDLPSPLGINSVADAAARDAATSGELVSKTEILAPGRSVATLTPQVTQVVPEVSVKKVPVDVDVHVPTPVATPVATPIATPVAVPAYASYSYAAPEVHLKTIAAAPAVVATGHLYSPYLAGVAAPQVEVKNLATGEVHYKTLTYGAVPYAKYI